MSNIKVKRVYDAPAKKDGMRILVDRLWPRGLTKQEADVDLWIKEVAPSTELRKWYNHDPEKWTEFKRRYFTYLRKSKNALKELLDAVHNNNVTFLYGSKESHMNNAQALKEYIESLHPKKEK
jgi:uncharacterized protein YeaO (DUF488 family)